MAFPFRSVRVQRKHEHFLQRAHEGLTPEMRDLSDGSFKMIMRYAQNAKVTAS